MDEFKEGEDVWYAYEPVYIGDKYNIKKYISEGIEVPTYNYEGIHEPGRLYYLYVTNKEINRIIRCTVPSDRIFKTKKQAIEFIQLKILEILNDFMEKFKDE